MLRSGVLGVPRRVLFDHSLIREGVFSPFFGSLGRYGDTGGGGWGMEILLGCLANSIVISQRSPEVVTWLPIPHQPPGASSGWSGSGIFLKAGETPLSSSPLPPPPPQSYSSCLL